MALKFQVILPNFSLNLNKFLGIDLDTQEMEFPTYDESDDDVIGKTYLKREFINCIFRARGFI